MRGAALVPALGALALASAGAPADAGDGPPTGKRKGKVVRVERGRAGAVGTPRLCPNVQGTYVTCPGRAPAVGEVGVIVNEQGAVGAARVSAVVPIFDGCGNEASWNATLEVTRGDPQTFGWQAHLLLEWPRAERLRVIPDNGQYVLPQGRNEWLMAGLDGDGDHQADHAVTMFACDPTGRPGQGASCVAYYERDDSEYVERRLDIRPACY